MNYTKLSTNSKFKIQNLKFPGGVYSIRGICPDDNLDDLEPLSEIVKNARVIAVGEGAHFMKEFWTIKQRLFKYFLQICRHRSS